MRSSSGKSSSNSAPTAGTSRKKASTLGPQFLQRIERRTAEYEDRAGDRDRAHEEDRDIGLRLPHDRAAQPLAQQTHDEREAVDRAVDHVGVEEREPSTDAAVKDAPNDDVLGDHIEVELVRDDAV